MVSTYPRVYHNQQKLRDAAAKSFDAKEVREETALYEYPITRGIEKSFEFGMKKTSLKQINRKIEPKERKECFERSINDPGVFRGIVDDGKNIIGVVAHPERDIHIHERAYLEPLNSQGRCCIRSYRNRIALSRSQTWPRRWRNGSCMRKNERSQIGALVERRRWWS